MRFQIKKTKTQRSIKKSDCCILAKNGKILDTEIGA